jgi:hypothetical protein
MYRIVFAFVVLAFLFPSSARAELQAALKDPPYLHPGAEAEVSFALSNSSGASVTRDMLRTVHTQKIHLLIVDETLTDYQHVHPGVRLIPGLYSARFTPRTAGNYTVWIDVTPMNGPHQYIPLQLKGDRPCSGPCVNKRLSLNAGAGGLKAVLSFDGPLKAGQAVMGMVEVSRVQGGPVQLDPVMGAMAHIVGFAEDLSGVVHTHPMDDSGEIMFHLEPEKPGFVKLFVQLRYAGQDIFLPFGVMVD